MSRFLILCIFAAASLVASPPTTIIIFGDSITAGSALPKDQRHQVWVKLIEDRSGGALILINEGKGGRPTASVPEFEAMLKRQPKADALVIALGMNDSRNITPDCAPKAVANIRAMIEKSAAGLWRQTSHPAHRPHQHQSSIPLVKEVDGMFLHTGLALGSVWRVACPKECKDALSQWQEGDPWQRLRPIALERAAQDLPQG